MSEGYIETALIEANRSRSQEALSGNNENPSSWTNTLGDIYHLKAGDRVSLYGGYVSEKGAGSEKTIEIKGSSLGKTKSFTYTTQALVKEPLTQRPIENTVSQVTEDIELRDNVVNLIMSYYKNTNGTGYISLPRAFVSLGNDGEPGRTVSSGSGMLTQIPYEGKDIQPDTGYLFTCNATGVDAGEGDQNMRRFFVKGDNYSTVDDNDINRISNDNSKFTIMLSRFSKLGVARTRGGEINGGGEGLVESSLGFTVSPEFREYYQFRDKVEISVEKGFNSAQFIAENLTKKLQEITSNEVMKWVPGRDITDSREFNPKPINVTRVTESNTYKAMNCMTNKLCTQDQYIKATQAGGTNGDGVFTYDRSDIGIPLLNYWYNNFQAIAMKRPELYEKGQLINFYGVANDSGGFDNYTPDRLLGSRLRASFDLTAEDEPLRTLIPYTKDNLKILKDFINIQELYPEIWESWNGVKDDDLPETFTYGDGTYYNSRHTIDNTRFFHINRINASEQTELVNESVAEEFAFDAVVASDSGATQIDIPYGGRLFRPSKAGGEEFVQILLSDNPATGSPAFSNIKVTNAENIDPLDPVLPATVGQPIQRITLKTALPIATAVGRPLIIRCLYLSQGQTHAETAKGNYSSGATQINISYGGTLYNYDDNVRVGIYASSATGFNYVGVTNAVQIPGEDVQILTLSAGIDADVSFLDELVVFTTTADDVNNFNLDHATLGSSGYRLSHALRNTSGLDLADISKYQLVPRMSMMMLVYYNKADRDVYYDNPSLEDNRLTYGCFTKESYTDSDGNTGDFINIHPRVDNVDFDTTTPWLQMLPRFATETNYADPDEPDPTTVTTIEAGRKWGYDLHATAVGQPQICLYNGKSCGANYYGEQFPKRFIAPSEGDETDVNEDESTKGYMNRRYVGADSPKINWDGEHFNISDLHTAENLASRLADGGRYAAGINNDGDDGANGANTAFIYEVSDVPDAQGDIIYKVNPSQDLSEYCPQLAPYSNTFEIFTRNGSSTADGAVGKQLVKPFNNNYESFEIYDSKSGIFFEDMGYDEANWERGLWGVMGFSYQQFNGSENNRLKRVDNSNIDRLRSPTTNAEITETDTKNYVTNENGIVHFTDNLPCPFAMYQYNASGLNADVLSNGTLSFNINPEINVKTSSIKLIADNFPTSMIRGYYTVRSDIIPQSIFVGGQSNITNMPIVGIINKENPQSDYYFAGESDVSFTIGKPTSLSSIKVGLFDPDGTPATVGNSSSIIFKVERQINTSFNIIGDILADSKGKAKF